MINTILGLWLMISPGIFQYSSAAADNGHIAGPIIVTFSIVAIWEATRVVRKWNFPVGIWLLAAPWILGYENTLAIVSDMSVGVLVLIFASIPGKIEKSYGGGWSSLWQKNPEHIQKSKQN
ncbi:SPW repeat protein [Gramella sp. KN1008]|uniref:SPW repeat domain-containing protein n=1 Tax=Gramella sp. KN1008 TaxID=2529298 RepID=UPI001A94E779|nr:SPW repeat protein [Gramella sp. KN1008]